MEFVCERDEVNGVIRFKGSLTMHEVADLNLAPIERACLASPSMRAADMLLDLELIFRRHAEQHPEANPMVQL